ETQVAVFGFQRDLRNPIATGTLIEIGRRAGGIRFTAARAVTRRAESPRVVAGFDLQRMRDDRRNRLTTVPADSIQVDQREIVTELGPFAELLWPVDRRWMLSAGARYDRITFDVEDHHLTDGSDESGSRTMAALSGSAGLSYLVSRRLTVYANAGTAFETPTTTELANQPGGSGGFNRSLGPQRAVSLEIGGRGTAGRWIRFSVAAYLNRIRDAIVQFQEAGGRAYFRNAGRLNNDGFEAGITVVPTGRLALSAAYTWAHYRFADYVVVSGAAADTLDGRTLPGVPEHFVRLEARASPGAGAWILADYTVSSAVWADDANTLRAGGWGIADLSLTWPVRLDQWTLELTAGVTNLFDRSYVSSVTVNGFNGRVFEPGEDRTWYGGVRITAGSN
ncbi:MAG: TonB-dependent receptor, partial [Gemmatimonadales bacterium]